MTRLRPTASFQQIPLGKKTVTGRKQGLLWGKCVRPSDTDHHRKHQRRTAKRNEERGAVCKWHIDAALNSAGGRPLSPSLPAPQQNTTVTVLT